MTAGGLARHPRAETGAAPARKLATAAAPDRRVRVMMLLGDLNGGGAERVALTLLRRCDPAALDMRIGIMRRTGTLLDEPAPERLTALAQWPRSWVEAIGTPGQVADLIGQTDPHVVMSFGMGVDALMWPALRLMGKRAPRWICRQDSNPDAEIVDLGTGPILRWITTRYMRAIQASAHARVAVSSDLAAKADRGSRWSGLTSQVIHNPLDLAQIERDAARPLPVTPVRPFIVAAGRLVHQKGYDLLIRAFADSRAARGMELIILGEGPLEGALRAQAAAAGVADRVRFPGYQENPWAWFARARLAVVPSRWEGFGNVVVRGHGLRRADPGHRLRFRPARAGDPRGERLGGEIGGRRRPDSGPRHPPGRSRPCPAAGGGGTGAGAGFRHRPDRGGLYGAVPGAGEAFSTKGRSAPLAARRPQRCWRSSGPGRCNPIPAPRGR